MIGRVAGRIDYRSEDHVLIDVGGVGYLVFCSERTLADLPGVGEAVALYTDLLVREDVLQLYGFTTLAEKEWHRLLMTVQGVGAKASLSILGVLGPDGLSRAIALGDIAAVKAARGIGPKTAQRVVIELKDKAPHVIAMAATETVAAKPATMASEQEMDVIEPHARPVARPHAAAQAEALSALSNLGYASGDAAAAVTRAAGDLESPSTPELIRAALRLLAPKA